MLSIIATVIDNLEVTSRFVSSVRQYTLGKYELILIDNGSKDKKAIQDFRKEDDQDYRFSKITDLARVWNKGIELAGGDYIAVVNNDVVVPPNWFALLKQTLKNKNAGMVSPLTLWLIESRFKYKQLKNWNLDFVTPKPFKLRKFKEVVWVEFCVFRRKVLIDVGGYNEVYKRLHAEDLEVVFQLFNKGYDVWVDPRVFVYHQGGASHIKSIISLREEDKIGR